MTEKRGIGRRINQWLDEAPGETFKDGKWRFWFLALAGLSLLNAGLTALVFRTGGNLQNYMGAIVVAVGALLAWIAVGALHYSDSNDSSLARGVSALDSVTLLFVVAHFCFLLWVYGHISTLKGAEADYKAASEKFNAEASKVSEDNVKIAEAGARIAEQTTKAERLRNDAAYQMRKAAEAGARIGGGRQAQAGSIGPSLSTAPIELERPTKPGESSTAFLSKWDWWVRMANFGELALAVITLIFIRNRTAATNARSSTAYRSTAPRSRPVEDFPDEIDVEDRRDGSVSNPRNSPRLDRTRNSDNGRQSPVSGDSEARKDALKILREHLKDIAFYNPGVWFKADLVRGGVTIRLFKKDHGHEIAIAQTTQSDKLLAAVERPDFQARLIDELIYQGFPIEKDGG
ncbi:MAG: hypothetical protein ACREAM_07370 [Blastocatellia bacterium]